MGYEVFLIKTETNQESLEEIQKPVPFPPHGELLPRIKARFPGLNDSNPAWAYLSGTGIEDFSMELNIGELGTPIECIMLIRPCGRDGIWAVRELCRLLQCRAWDSGGQLKFDAADGWLKETLDISDSFFHDRKHST